MNPFKQSIEAVLPQVKAWRRHLHEYPEPSFEEFATTEYIIEQIKDLPGVTYKRLAKTGVVAYLSGTKPGPTIAMRADIDALRMPEKSGVSFASKNEGVMHACGHDAHTAMLLGALYVLQQNVADLKGKFVLIFQAAEEDFPGGARELVAKGVLDGVDAIIGQHSQIPTAIGKIATCSGYLTANSDSFSVTVVGKGGHASLPEICLDPIPVAAQIVTALQQIVTRQVAARETAVLSVTQLHAGTADNIIPDTVTIRGTVRTYSGEVRNMIANQIGHVAKTYADAFDMKVEYEYERGYDALYNTDVFTNAVMDVAHNLYGAEAVQVMKPEMGGEDFAFYLQKIPGCFYFLGMGNKETGCVYPGHSSQYRIDEDAFGVGISIMLCSVLRFQKLIIDEQ